MKYGKPLIRLVPSARLPGEYYWEARAREGESLTSADQAIAAYLYARRRNSREGRPNY